MLCALLVCLIICAVLSASAAVCPQDSEISPCKCTNPESPIVSCDASATDGTQLRQVFQNFAKGPIQDVLISNIKGDFSVPADFFYGTQLTGNFTFTCQEFHFDYPTKYMNFDNESFVSDGKWISPTYLGFDGCHMEHMGPQVLSGMTSLKEIYIKDYGSHFPSENPFVLPPLNALETLTINVYLGRYFKLLPKNTPVLKKLCLYSAYVLPSRVQ